MPVGQCSNMYWYIIGASQAGMTGFGAFRNNTVANMQAQQQRSQGMIPYQMGVNFLDSQAGKTGFGMPRQVTNFVCLFF